VNSSPHFQTLFDLYIAGHFESIFIIMAIISIGIANKTKAINETTKSNILFQTNDHQSNCECVYSIATIDQIFSGL
jgi:hypothetical protein